MRFLGWGCVFAAAAIFIWTLVIGQIGCPLARCKGPDGDAWMPAFFFTPFGLPALVMSVFFIAKKIWPDSPNLSRAGLWLKYLFFVIIGLVILSVFIFGYVSGRVHSSHQTQVHQ